MIQLIGTNGEHIFVNSFDRENLPDYCGLYFSFKKDLVLHDLSEKAFRKVICNELKKEKPKITSKIVIKGILMELDESHNFCSKFYQRYPDTNIHKVLGLQLYRIMVEENEEKKENAWYCFQEEHPDRLFSETVYCK